VNHLLAKRLNGGSSLSNRWILEAKLTPLDYEVILAQDGMEALDNDQQEVEMFKKNPSQYGSVFFIMKRR